MVSDLNIVLLICKSLLLIITVCSTRTYTFFEERLGKKIDINSFNNSLNIPKQLIANNKDENRESKKKYKQSNILSTLLKRVDTLDFIATLSSSVTLFVTGLGMMVMSILNDLCKNDN